MHRGAAGSSAGATRNVRVGVASFEVRDGWIYCLQADPVIEIADLLLEQADPHFVSVGDGIVTFHCENGDVSYGLRDHDDIREVWIGVRPGYDDADG